MKRITLIKSIVLSVFLFSCVSCGTKKESSIESASSSENSIFDEETLDNISLNSIGEMNYYLGKTLTMSKSQDEMKKAYDNVKNALNRHHLSTNENEDPEQSLSEDHLDALPEGLEEPTHGEKEIDYITFNYDIYYKDGTVAYFKDIPNYTISYCISFRFILEDENNYLAEKIGTGTIYCVITDFGIGVATFKNGDKFYSCCPDGGDPGVLYDSNIFYFGREYVGMYFYKGNITDELGEICFYKLNDCRNAYITIQRSYENHGHPFNPFVDREYTSVTRIEPLTLTWEEYLAYIKGKLNDNEDLTPEELKEKIKNQWEERLQFDNATFLIQRPDSPLEKRYLIDGKYYNDEKIDVTEENDYKLEVVSSILGNLDSLFEINENYYHFDQMEVELNDGVLHSIKINFGIRYYVYNIGTTVLPE